MTFIKKLKKSSLYLQQLRIIILPIGIRLMSDTKWFLFPYFMVFLQLTSVLFFQHGQDTNSPLKVILQAHTLLFLKAM
jgi:hypothetical protein